MENCVLVVASLLGSLNPGWSDEKNQKYAEVTCRESIESNIDPLIPIAIMQHETDFNHRKRYKNKNGSIDYGVMQFNCKKRRSRIFLKWRRWWCHPKRRNRILTIEGGITAGMTELRFWRDLERSRTGDRHFVFSLARPTESLSSVPSDRDYLLERDIIQIDNNLFRTDLIPPNLPFKQIKYDFQNPKFPEESEKKILRSYWWIKRYNWNSKKHWISVLFIYKVLFERRESNYAMISSGFYRQLARKKLLKKCITTKDMCLKRYKEWQEKRQRHRDRLKRRNSTKPKLSKL